jgi:hypothetical protein
MKKMIGVVVIALAAIVLDASAFAESAPVTVTISEVPPDGDGGPDSHGNIGGRVAGLDDPSKYAIVLYAHTNRWYVQPEAASPRTDIAADGSWSNWTHLGHRYAALVVPQAFEPEAKLDSLPRVGDGVVAKAEVAASK